MAAVGGVASGTPASGRHMHGMACIMGTGGLFQLMLFRPLFIFLVHPSLMFFFHTYASEKNVG